MLNIGMSKNVLHITDLNFEVEVLRSGDLFLLDFWANWCGPCLAIAPHIEALADEYVGKIRIGKLDVDGNAEVAAKFEIRSIPTLIFFKNGKMIDRVVGGISKIVLEKLIKKHIGID